MNQRNRQAQERDRRMGERARRDGAKRSRIAWHRRHHARRWQRDILSAVRRMQRAGQRPEATLEAPVFFWTALWRWVVRMVTRR